MKKYIVKFFLIAVILFIPKTQSGQCESDDFMDKCAGSLGGFTFLKSFSYKSKTDNKKEISYLFSKGSGYVIVVCDQNKPGSKMIMSLYDRGHKFIASTYNKSTKKHYPSINYPCSATGIYYIETQFESETDACGVSIIGFEKKK